MTFECRNLIKLDDPTPKKKPSSRFGFLQAQLPATSGSSTNSSPARALPGTPKATPQHMKPVAEPKRDSKRRRSVSSNSGSVSSSDSSESDSESESDSSGYSSEEDRRRRRKSSHRKSSSKKDSRDRHSRHRSRSRSRDDRSSRKTSSRRTRTYSRSRSPARYVHQIKSDVGVGRHPLPYCIRIGELNSLSWTHV